MNTVRQLGVWVSQVAEPTGPEAPAELQTLITRGLNFGWFIALACCFGMAIWGCGSVAYASKKQNFGGVNDGKKTIALSLGGAATLSMLRGLFAFFGV